MAKGEVVIKEQFCKGCGFCAHFCAKGCFRYPTDKLTFLGFPLPEFAEPEKCTACGVCAWLCMGNAIEVYKNVKGRPLGWHSSHF